MKFRKKANLDFEFDRFRFAFRKRVPAVVEKLRSLFVEWMREREANGTCACVVKDLVIGPPANPRQVDVLCGWFCDRCLKRLETAVSDRLSEAIGVYVGTDLSPYPAPELSFIRFEAKSAFFENGSTVQLAPYEICRSPVTTGQFDQFCAATAHVTTCEREGNGSFRLDETVEGVRPKDRGNIPVHSVSFDDALAYCHWARVRLPTEAELLAAALVDYRIMSSLEKQNFLFGAVGGRFEIDRFPDALAGLATEFVAGCSVPGKAIIRNGPYYVRETGWETQRRRHECRTDAYDLMTGFRVCRTTSNAT